MPRWDSVILPLKNPTNLPHHRSPDRRPPRMPICQRCSHCGYKVIIHGPVHIRYWRLSSTAPYQDNACGFNLLDIPQLLFREPELKLYRRVINGKMRRGGYLKIARRQLLLTVLPVRQSGTIPTPDRPAAPTDHRPALSAVVPSASCVKRYAVSVVRAVPDQPHCCCPLVTVRRSRKLTPFTTFGVSHRASTYIPAVCSDFCGQALHRWR